MYYYYLNETDHNCSLSGPHESGDTEKVTGQRSRSSNDGHRNLVNSTDLEPLKEFEPKLKQILPTVRPLTDQIFKVVGSKVKVIENIFQKYPYSS